VTSPPRHPDPYRPLFLVGLAHAVAGTLVWPHAAHGLVGYTGVVQSTHKMEGFQQSFVAGFMLTALGGLTHGGKSTKREMVLVTAAQIGVGVATLFGSAIAAHGAFLFGMLVLFVAAATRSRRGQSTGRPPRELVFIVTALVLGLVGAIVLVAGALRSDGVLLVLGTRFVAQGEVLTLVVGVGSMLIPTFLGHRKSVPLATAGVPLWRSRLGFYLLIAAVLAGSFALEGAGLGTVAALARALAVTAVLLGVWKIQKESGAGRLAFALRGAGVAILVGVWLTVAWPARPLLGEHLVFIGGFGLLTMGIATRVVVSHGGWSLDDEPRLLHPAALLALAAALVARLAAELVPAQAASLWATSGVSWIVAWLVWSASAVPRILGRAPSSAS
jgi:uncharacterized protein involved in response to NO